LSDCEELVVVITRDDVTDLLMNISFWWTIIYPTQFFGLV